MNSLVVKRFAKNIASNKLTNILVRNFLKLKYISSFIPENILQNVPIVGIVNFSLPTHKIMCLETDENDVISRALYWETIDGFEGGTIRTFMKVLKISHTFLDIGANTGLYSLIAALDSPKKKVYAFEPVPSVIEYFKRNVELNKVKNIEIITNAVTNYDGEQRYVPAGNLPTSASTLKDFREAEKRICVEAITLDSFVNANNISKVDSIKIDTEATEHTVLEGAKRTIKRDEPVIVCEVLKGLTEKYIHAVLDEMNYKYFLLSSEGIVEKEQIEGDRNYKDLNYLFISQTKIQEVMSLLAG